MELFYELLQVAIGTRDNINRTLSEDDWAEIYALSLKQAITGVIFLALEILTSLGQKPPLSLLYEWIGYNQQNVIQNTLLNTQCVEITNFFKDGGFRTCILKGQGNAFMYSVPESRTPGDIDVWIEGSREGVKKYVMEHFPNAKDGPMHISFQIKEGTEVEAHYVARRTYNPKYNKRLQNWINCYGNDQFVNYVSLTGTCDKEISIPTDRFNIVYQMSHIMGHFFEEGVGLRHFVDYFFLLKKFHGEDSMSYENIFEYLGLLKFARGVMWIETEILGLKKEYLICEPDERIGAVILGEIEKCGNLGHYDERYKMRKKGYLARGIADGHRLLKLALYFPQDALWMILMRIENQMWKIKNKYGRS